MPVPSIHLAPLHADQAAVFHRWISDPVAVRYSLTAFQRPHTLPQVEQWLAATLQDTNSHSLGIYLTGTDELIGYAGISGISRHNCSGEYFILLGEKRYWGQGIGTEVTRRVVALGFEQLQLHRIMLTVSEPNQGGVTAYLRAGFQLEGRLRQACYRDGAFHDKLLMSVLRAEWHA
ncbi:GNAT family N-acetyltransferase [Hymenobacter psychrophilus]|uniref:Protein N-acetyltransferase, RimJ/RimL family n=1 Tax=Hymenobacter psychrophilus TaxID=651662 RepID=A0A1H3NAV3_9BACT|nr:GNAT family protein [Hymenobacter psychrophilus]SDY85800.1 Protein N-acetyltransferase, RimJ/RimL family [Hymenobacter psychrophilus]